MLIIIFGIICVRIRKLQNPCYACVSKGVHVYAYAFYCVVTMRTHVKIQPFSST
jgi:hypothetical protein